MKRVTVSPQKKAVTRWAVWPATWKTPSVFDTKADALRCYPVRQMPDAYPLVKVTIIPIPRGTGARRRK